MKVKSACPDDDVLCIAEELAERLERRQPASPVERTFDSDCLPCVVADWDGDF
jgi:hypothetical protein